MFFFFKQKTAYEMRISDWGSDVCSSDLDPDDYQPRRRQRHRNRHPASAKRRRIGARPVKKAHVPLLEIIAAALLPAGCAVNNGAYWSEARPVLPTPDNSSQQRRPAPGERHYGAGYNFSAQTGNGREWGWEKEGWYV